MSRSFEIGFVRQREVFLNILPFRFGEGFLRILVELGKEKKSTSFFEELLFMDTYW